MVSPYIQIIPRTETRGKEAIRLPSKGSFLEISEISTIITDVRRSFTIYQVIIFYRKGGGLGAYIELNNAILLEKEQNFIFVDL